MILEPVRVDLPPRLAGCRNYHKSLFFRRLAAGIGLIVLQCLR
jgi:hypothetical protein